MKLLLLSPFRQNFVWWHRAIFCRLPSATRPLGGINEIASAPQIWNVSQTPQRREASHYLEPLTRPLSAIFRRRSENKVFLRCRNSWSPFRLLLARSLSLDPLPISPRFPFRGPFSLVISLSFECHRIFFNDWIFGSRTEPSSAGEASMEARSLPEKKFSFFILRLLTSLLHFKIHSESRRAKKSCPVSG